MFMKIIHYLHWLIGIILIFLHGFKNKIGTHPIYSECDKRRFFTTSLLKDKSEVR